MKRALTSIGLTILLGGTVPVVPEEMKLLYSAQGTASAQLRTETYCEQVSSSSPCVWVEKAAVEKPLLDDDGNGLVSWSVFADRNGNKVIVQIPDEQYARMGMKTDAVKGGGFVANPKESEYITLFESLNQKADAAIAFDAASGAADNGGVVTSLTFSHTVTGSDTFLVVTAGSNTTSNPTVNSVTYNGVAMTEVDERLNSTVRLSLSYLIAPTTGANNVVVTWSGAGTGAGQQLNAISASYTGAKQTGQPDSNGFATFTNATVLAISTTVVAENSWLSGTLNGNAGEMINGTGPETQRGVDRFNQVAIDTNGVVGTGAQTLDWDDGWTVNDTGVGLVISIAPAVAAATPINVSSDLILFE